MGRVTNAQKAAQARQRRSRKKKELQNLYELSIRDRVAENPKSTYGKARKLRKSSLKKRKSSNPKIQKRT